MISVGGTAVRITAPADGVAVFAPTLITLQVNAVTSGSNSLTKLEFFDGGMLLGTMNVSGNNVSVGYSLIDVAAGSHVYTVKATLGNGSIVTSAPVTVNVLMPADVVLSTLGSYFLAPTGIDLYAGVTPTAGTTIAKVEFFNGSSLIGTVTAAPYMFRWTNVAAGNYVVTANATDSQMLAGTPAPVSLTVGSSVTIQLSAVLNGSTVNDDAIQVSGSVGAPPNSAVTVNGQLASVTSTGQFFLNNLNHQAGVNSVTATVTAPDGQTASQVISITRSTVPATFVVTAPAGGLATATSPYDAAVTVENPGNGAFATVSVTCYDPAPGLVSTTLGTFDCSYTVPGVYTMRVTVKDALGGLIHEVVRTVKIDAPIDRFRMLTTTYSGVVERLKAGNIDGAVGSFTNTIREKYRAAFSQAGANLATMVNGFGTVRSLELIGDLAEISVVRTTIDGDLVFSVQLILDGDGIWRIDGF